jgi:hypothetical protein
MSIVFCLFFSKGQFLEFLSTFIDPELGKPLTEKVNILMKYLKNYALDCRFFTPDNPTSNFANVLGAVDVILNNVKFIRCSFPHICLDGW